MGEQVHMTNRSRKGMDTIREVYFIGIGGIGMSAVAKFFQSKGVKVAGYDKTATPLTKEMETSGIGIHYEENTDLIPKQADLVVYTPAVPAAHKELVYYRQHGYDVVKRSDVLQLITESSFNICIAGTHGKTTISTMTAHLLRDSGLGCTAFLGGVSVNYGTNFWSVAGSGSGTGPGSESGTDPGSEPGTGPGSEPGTGHGAGAENVCVIEADEYDRSFLKLSPDIAVISAMDPDHLDIYGTVEAMEQAFIDFSGRVKPGGLLVSKFGLKKGKELKAARHLTYSLQDSNAGAYAANIRMANGSYTFDAILRDNKLENVKLNMGGMHNIENAIAAMAVVSSLGIDNERIRSAVESFRGVKRRFEYVIKNDRVVFIDDYAHHPEELKALINGAKNLFTGKKCTVIFQPHLYTRTRDLADGFAAALSLADEVFLLPVYPARELPIAGVDSAMIADRITDGKGIVIQKDELLKIMDDKIACKNTPELVITAGAGDIDMLIEPIKKTLAGI